MSSVQRLLFAMALVALVLLGREARGQQGAPVRPAPIVILAHLVKGRIVYTVDSKPALPNLLRVLSTLEEERGKDCPVVALVDDRAPISEFGNIDGTAGKAQLTNIRLFTFTHDGRMMSEIRWLPAVPYSTNPPISRDPLGIR